MKAAVVMVDGMHPGSTREETETGRLLRRQLTSLPDDLETTRPLLQHVTERLGSEAERHVRRSRPDRGRAEVAVARVSGVLLTADTEGRQAGQDLQRAQTMTIQVLRGTDAICEAARERLRVHRDPSLGSTIGPPVPR